MNNFSGGSLSSMGTCVGLKALLRGQNFQYSTAVEHNSRLTFYGSRKNIFVLFYTFNLCP